MSSGVIRCWGLGTDGHLGYSHQQSIGDDELPGSVGPVLAGACQGSAIVAGGGKDDAFGDLGNDLLFGDNGNDLLEGQEGDDRMYGGNGRDRLHGYEGVDHAFGGPDWDHCRYNNEHRDSCIS